MCCTTKDTMSHVPSIYIKQKKWASLIFPLFFAIFPDFAAINAYLSENNGVLQP